MCWAVTMIQSKWNVCLASGWDGNDIEACILAPPVQDGVKQMVQGWADESVPMRPRSARGLRLDGTATPGRIYVRTPAATPRAERPPARDKPAMPVKVSVYIDAADETDSVPDLRCAHQILL